MSDSKVFMFPENGRSSSLDTASLLALTNNSGFGNNPFWMMFMLPFLYPFFNMFGGYGNGWGNGFGGNNGGVGFLANQLNNDNGRDLILQAINGRADALTSLAGILNTDVATVQSGINQMSVKLQEVGSTVGLTGLQVINSIQNGNSTLARQLSECCCENRLLTTQQGYESRIATIEQTNQLGSQADRNTRSLADAIATLQTNMTREFCDVRERELQDKLDTANAKVVTLQGQIDNANQTAAITGYINSQIAPLQAQVTTIANKQPNTVPVQWPNLTAVNTTPYGGWYGGWNNGWGSNSFWN